MNNWAKLVLISIIITSCNNMSTTSSALGYSKHRMTLIEATPIINENGKTLYSRYDTPNMFTRVGTTKGSFQEFLRTLPLKPEGTVAKYYNGSVKDNYNIYSSVVDFPLTDKDLQKCADGILRLRAEYLYRTHQFDKINFRVSKPNVKSYLEYVGSDLTYDKYLDYLNYIMNLTTSVCIVNDMKEANIEDIQIGDVFIQRGNPNGHAVIVVDMATRDKNKIFLLAQSFTPAQDIQIIQNPNDDSLSPWYMIDGEFLTTPEWRFMTSDIMRFNFD